MQVRRTIVSATTSNIASLSGSGLCCRTVGNQLASFVVNPSESEAPWLLFAKIFTNRGRLNIFQDTDELDRSRGAGCAMTFFNRITLLGPTRDSVAPFTRVRSGAHKQGAFLLDASTISQLHFNAALINVGRVLHIDRQGLGRAGEHSRCEGLGRLIRTGELGRHRR